MQLLKKLNTKLTQSFCMAYLFPIVLTIFQLRLTNHLWLVKFQTCNLTNNCKYIVHWLLMDRISSFLRVIHLSYRLFYREKGNQQTNTQTNSNYINIDDHPYFLPVVQRMRPMTSWQTLQMGGRLTKWMDLGSGRARFQTRMHCSYLKIFKIILLCFYLNEHWMNNFVDK